MSNEHQAGDTRRALAGLVIFLLIVALWMAQMVSKMFAEPATSIQYSLTVSGVLTVVGLLGLMVQQIMLSKPNQE